MDNIGIAIERRALAGSLLRDDMVYPLRVAAGNEAYAFTNGLPVLYRYHVNEESVRAVLHGPFCKNRLELGWYRENTLVPFGMGVFYFLIINKWKGRIQGGTN
ncbi:hypothetical protein EDM57_11570 [Brevibacillus gelatini]|uniref:Uncharacterized protein n=1 Tax=Brevibacillus gelatini TaxID=1655277 RepID=A0A3M8B0F1_9BACL|nr:hypothetical protein EDM57_11570 [Brevibacillus gelatini]